MSDELRAKQMNLVADWYCHNPVDAAKQVPICIAAIKVIADPHNYEWEVKTYGD